VARLSELLDEFFYRPDEDVSALGALLAGGDEVPVEAAEERAEEFLAFVLEGECYAVPLTNVREIVKVPPLTELPRASPQLLGVMNLRGEVMPVYDLKHRLRLVDVPAVRAGPDAAPPPRAARIIVVRDLLDGVEGSAGLWVDAVRDVVRLRPSTLEPPPPGVATGERPAVVGLGRRGAELFILLDLEQALA
jgi:purine-binding chemotaxis protein CheW